MRLCSTKHTSENIFMFLSAAKCSLVLLPIQHPAFHFLSFTSHFSPIPPRNRGQQGKYKQGLAGKTPVNWEVGCQTTQRTQTTSKHSGSKPFKHWSESDIAQSCPTLCDPVDCSPPGSSVHGILQARIPKWVAVYLLNTSADLWPKGCQFFHAIVSLFARVTPQHHKSGTHMADS